MDRLTEEGNPFTCFQRTPSTNEKLGFGALDQSQALILAIFKSPANLAFQISVIDRSMTLPKSPHPDLFETLKNVIDRSMTLFEDVKNVIDQSMTLFEETKIVIDRSMTFYERVLLTGHEKVSLNGH